MITFHNVELHFLLCHILLLGAARCGPRGRTAARRRAALHGTPANSFRDAWYGSNPVQARSWCLALAFFSGLDSSGCSGPAAAGDGASSAGTRSAGRAPRLRAKHYVEPHRNVALIINVLCETTNYVRLLSFRKQLGRKMWTGHAPPRGIA